MNVEHDEFEDRPELVRKRARSILITRVAQVAVVIVVLVLLTFLAVTAWEGHTTRKTLIDCTAPTGQCYKEGQERTAEVVARINKDGVIREQITRETAKWAAYCARQQGSMADAEFESCIKEMMK